MNKVGCVESQIVFEKQPNIFEQFIKWIIPKKRVEYLIVSRPVEVKTFETQHKRCFNNTNNKIKTAG